MSLTSAAAATSLTQYSAPTVVEGNVLPADWDLPRLSHAEFDRMGQDLHITDAHGDTLVIRGYFLTGNHADLAIQSGGYFHASWVDRLSHNDQNQFAQTADTPSQSIGTVQTLNGTVTVERADGTTETLQVGDQIFQDDVLSTGSDSTVGIVFADGSNFSLGPDGKMILDEMVYDSATEEGSGSVSVLGGTFAFISGQIAKTSPDAMKVTTPSATIGFRGTSGSGEVTPDGETTVVLIRDPDGTVGEVVIVTEAGIATLSDVLQAATIGLDPDTPITVRVMSPAEFQQQYGTVAASLPAAQGESGRRFLDQATNTDAPTEGQDQNGQDGNENGDNQGDGNSEGDETPEDTPPDDTETVTFSTGEDTFSGTEGDDTLGGGTGDDLIGDGTTGSNTGGTNAGSTNTSNDDDDDSHNDNQNTDDDETSETGITNLALTSGSHSGTIYADNLAFASGASGTIDGLAGNDTLTGNSGDDTLIGGDGNDLIDGDGGIDNHLSGGAGNDTFIIDTINTAGTIIGGTGTDTLDFSNISEHISIDNTNLNNNNLYDANIAGADYFYQYIDIEKFIFGSSKITFAGGSSAETVLIHDGPGTGITGSSIDGGAGNDLLSFDDSNILGVAVDFTTSSYKLVSSNVTLSESVGFSNFETVKLSDGNDAAIVASANPVTIDLNDGNDALSLTGGAHSLIGGDGYDVLSTDLLTDRKAIVDLSTSSDGTSGTVEVYNTSCGCSEGTSTVSGFELYDLSNYNDTFTGGNADDVVIGGNGDDVLTGNAGNDKFAFHTDTTGTPAAKFTALGTDTIHEFTTGEDQIVLDSSIFGTVGNDLTIVIDADGTFDSSYGSGAGILAYGEDLDENGTIDSYSLYYVQDLSDTSTGKYQFATLKWASESDVSIATSDFASYGSREDLFGLATDAMKGVVDAAVQAQS